MKNLISKCFTSKFVDLEKKGLLYSSINNLSSRNLLNVNGLYICVAYCIQINSSLRVVFSFKSIVFYSPKKKIGQHILLTESFFSPSIFELNFLTHFRKGYWPLLWFSSTVSKHKRSININSVHIFGHSSKSTGEQQGHPYKL